MICQLSILNKVVRYAINDGAPTYPQLSIAGVNTLRYPYFCAAVVAANY